jgi:rhamnogalacturonyl hydrolase YesR
MLMAKKIGRHIDNAESSDGRNFYKAMDFLASYMGKEVEQWPYKQISGWKESQQNFCRDLYRTATYLDTSRKDYLDMYSKYRILDVSDRFNLLYVKATDVDNAYIAASSQLRYAVDCAEKARKLESNMAENRVEPRTMNADGSVVLVNPRDWCSGFFPGNLWQMYSYTNDSYWRKEAVTWTWRIEDSKWYGGTHDLGFIMYNSFGKAYELTDERSYRDVVVDAANTLITRYNPTIKAIRSWDHNKDKWKYPVIIDNMMNLEMLFEATRLTGDSTYYKIAVQHANTTMRNHFRNDYSSYHVVDYEPSTGDVRARQTAQGYSDDSFWSRGQGWGLYGYVMCYRYTKDMAYLRQSERIADFFINLPNMPADMIPYWDMNMPSVKGLTPDNVDENIPRDASAAAVVASGLYELSLYVDNDKAERYRDVADKIINTLTRSYTSPIGENCGFLLLHSVGHYPAGSEVDVPLIYADYYYLEALSRKGKIDRGNK